MCESESSNVPILWVNEHVHCASAHLQEARASLQQQSQNMGNPTQCLSAQTIPTYENCQDMQKPPQARCRANNGRHVLYTCVLCVKEMMPGGAWCCSLRALPCYPQYMIIIIITVHP